MVTASFVCMRFLENKGNFWLLVPEYLWTINRLKHFSSEMAENSIKFSVSYTQNWPSAKLIQLRLDEEHETSCITGKVSRKISDPKKQMHFLWNRSSSYQPKIHWSSDWGWGNKGISAKGQAAQSRETFGLQQSRTWGCQKATCILFQK